MLVEKIAWQGVLLSVQPRIRLTRSFDQRSHTYLGYTLKVSGRVGSEAREFLVGIGQGAHTKHQLQAGNAVSGNALPVADPRLETVEFYKVSKLKVGLPEAEDEATATSVARCSTAAGGLPRARSSATRRANLPGEVLELHLGMPDAGRDDYRSVESESAPLPNRDLLLRSSFLPAPRAQRSSRGLIDTVVEMKRRNSRFGCRKIVSNYRYRDQ